MLNHARFKSTVWVTNSRRRLTFSRFRPLLLAAQVLCADTQADLVNVASCHAVRAGPNRRGEAMMRRQMVACFAGQENSPSTSSPLHSGENLPPNLKLASNRSDPFGSAVLVTGKIRRSLGGCCLFLYRCNRLYFFGLIANTIYVFINNSNHICTFNIRSLKIMPAYIRSMYFSA